MMANYFDLHTMPHYNVQPFSRSSKISTLNPRKELLPLRVESSETPPLYSERSRVNAESIYSTDTGYSSQHKKRFPKTLLKDKVMLQYCGRRVVDSSPDETHSCSFESNISEHEKDHCDSLFSGNQTFDGMPYCSICYKCEESRCSELGYNVPHPMHNGPWKTHRARDEHGNPECPLLFFQACVCGFFGSVIHPPRKCPFVQALGHL